VVRPELQNDRRNAETTSMVQRIGIATSENSRPLISIVTPSFNQAKYLEETICSVIEQKYPLLEYIVIDGASTDGSVEIIKRYANEITYWVSEKDNGQTDAINKGFRHSKGQIIAWLNSDDTYLPGVLDFVSDAFLKNPDALAVFGDFLYVDSKGHPLRHRHVSKRLDYNLLLSHNYIGQPALFFHRRAFETLGLLDESYHYLMDWEYVLRLAKTRRLYKIDQTLATARIHREAKTAAFATNQYQGEYQRMKEIHKPLGFKDSRFQRLNALLKRAMIVFRDGPTGYFRVFKAQHEISFHNTLMFFTSRLHG
jgi:glycosyltransferase involved in cell wall biosynthesis